MSIIRITEGESFTFIEGGWTVFTDEFDAYAGNISHFTAENGTLLGTPDKEPKASDNSFIPIITAINDEGDLFGSYEVIINDKKEWTFSDLLDVNLQNQKSREIKFKTESLKTRVKFKTEKGSSKANDSDGGNITAFFFKKGEKNSSFTTVINNVKYGGTFYLDWDRSKGVHQIQFYADDNDSFFDGGVSNVYCGAVNLFKLDCPVCGEWEVIPTVIPENLYEGYRTDCHVATHKQLDVMGYKEGMPRYQTAIAVRDKNRRFIRMDYFKDQYIKGTKYIKQALKNGIPVTVGVDNHVEITPGNPDLTTDHFVVIVGMGTDEKGNYFHFYDNADSRSGTSLNNKLYCVCKENKLAGSTDPLSRYGGGLTYTVTSIRTSIKK